ncbi:hypothetical protein [Corynebacterium sp.]|uniref:hypothetical protein n=1 Tax=Corynebacterium sp. TaxID=1720 RepID=UPI0026DF6F89|nr:hypothetical protein [Corynebacterium sp.]MDO5512920.1 hypothetical protein [Corynebacterium sp.]
MNNAREVVARALVTMPFPSALDVVASGPIPGGQHVLLTDHDSDGHSVIQFMLDDDGTPMLHGATEAGLALCENLNDGDDIGIGRFLGVMPADLQYVRHSRDEHRIDVYLTDDLDVGEKFVLTLYRRVWPGTPVEVEALSTVTGRYSPDLLGRIEWKWHGRRYILGTIRRLPTGTRALEYFRAGAEAQVFSYDEGVELGATVRYVHDSLLMAFPYEQESAEVIQTALLERLEAFRTQCPELLDNHVGWITAWYHQLRGTMLVHRLHGNLTLDRIWLEEDNTWLIGGWEGDVRLPMAERARLWSPLRDLAILNGSLVEACGGNGSWCRMLMASICEGYGDPIYSVPFISFVLDRICEQLVCASLDPEASTETLMSFLTWFAEVEPSLHRQLEESSFMRFS